MSSPRSQPLAPSDTDSTTQIVALVNAGKAALAEGDLDTALELFEQVVDRFPEQAEGHNNLGSLYTALGDFPRAEKCFSRVLKLMPDHPNVHYNRGVARIRQEKTDGAIVDFDAVLASQPNDTEALNNKGVALFMQGHFGRAADALRQALAHRPDYPQAVLNLCDCLVAADDHAAAIAACERYLVANADPEVRRHHMQLLSAAGAQTLDKAVAAAELLLAQARDDTAARAQLGRLLQAREALAATA